MDGFSDVMIKHKIFGIHEEQQKWMDGWQMKPTSVI
jgi:hypothetical protein